MENIIDRAKFYVNYLIGVLATMKVNGDAPVSFTQFWINKAKETIEGLLLELGEWQSAAYNWEVSATEWQALAESKDVEIKKMLKTAHEAVSREYHNNVIQSYITTRENLTAANRKLEMRIENMARGNTFATKEYFDSACEERQTQINRLVEEIKVLQEAAQKQDDYKERYLALKDACEDSFANSAKIRDLVGA